jgi:DNA-binding GntR family transcriptional regulator
LQCENKSRMIDRRERLVEGRSLHEEIVDILRQMVLEGRLKAEERVLALDFCRERSLSRTPTREAIKIPAAEQLELRASCGAAVTDAALRARRRLDAKA